MGGQACVFYGAAEFSGRRRMASSGVQQAQAASQALRTVRRSMRFSYFSPWMMRLT